MHDHTEWAFILCYLSAKKKAWQYTKWNFIRGNVFLQRSLWDQTILQIQWTNIALFINYWGMCVCNFVIMAFVATHYQYIHF
jgi:hypothetical protein